MESTRRSDRQLGEDIVIENIDFGVTSRSLKALKEGEGGGNKSDHVMQKNGITFQVSDYIVIWKEKRTIAMLSQMLMH